MIRLVALLLALAPACSLVAVNDAIARASPALISDRSYGFGQQRDLGTEALPATKVEALARFGPPGELLPLVDGDVFVYRWRELELDSLNLHTGFIGPALPIYSRFDGDQRDRSLMLSFGRDGRLRAWALDAPAAPAAGGEP